MLQHKHHRFVDKLGSTWMPIQRKAYVFGLVGRTDGRLLACLQHTYTHTLDA